MASSFHETRFYAWVGNFAGASHSDGVGQDWEASQEFLLEIHKPWSGRALLVCLCADVPISEDFTPKLESAKLLLVAGCVVLFFPVP